MPSTHISLHYHIVFSTKGRRRIKVQQYIANQIAHHRTKTFEEEYLDLLRLSGVEFDEKYLW